MHIRKETRHTHTEIHVPDCKAGGGKRYTSSLKRKLQIVGIRLQEFVFCCLTSVLFWSRVFSLCPQSHPPPPRECECIFCDTVLEVWTFVFDFIESLQLRVCLAFGHINSIKTVRDYNIVEIGLNTFYIFDIATRYGSQGVKGSGLNENSLLQTGSSI